MLPSPHDPLPQRASDWPSVVYLRGTRTVPASLACFLSCWLLAIAASPPALAQGVHLDGIVRDTTGAPIPNAQVTVRAKSYSATVSTSAAGDFAFDHIPEASGSLTVFARGLQQAVHNWASPSGGPVHLVIVLGLERVNQQVVVTAARTETRLSDSPVSVVDLTREALQSTPALTLDDSLEQIPGFSLFRRASSRTANPTTQGVSLRGLGASGTSRALVLEDGIPLNDPFGGWIFWDRMPSESISSVEVEQEGASSLYGSDALGGVVQFRTRPAEPAGLSLETSYGNQNTPDLSLWTGGEKGRWESTLSADLFHTDGYILVPQSARGTVDSDAGSEHATVNLMLARNFGAQNEIFASSSFLDESRTNGTPLQNNSIQLGEGALGANVQLGTAGLLTLRFYTEGETYHQTFSSVAADRDSETLTDIQTVPAQGVGGSAVWSRALGNHQTLVAGFDAHEEIGASHEVLLSASKDTSAGGRQRTTGEFGEDLIQITPRWLLALSVRFDQWSNFDASLFSAPIGSPASGTTTPYANRSNNAFSPRVSLIHQLNSHVSWSASIYRAFRAPTLNELYRSFRQGNTLTESNANLTAERLTGGEAGVNVNALNRRLDFRGAFFFNEIIDPVANVTLTTTPTLITRQRQNLGRTSAPGFEIDAVARLTSRFQLSAGYQFVDAKVISFPQNTALVGLWVAQVPRNVLTFQSRYEFPSRFSVSVDGRFVGKQFDDDQNQYPLGNFFVLDAMAWRSMGRGITLFAAAENLFDVKYDTAATPVPQLGLPIVARFGLRLDLPACK